MQETDHGDGCFSCCSMRSRCLSRSPPPVCSLSAQEFLLFLLSTQKPARFCLRRLFLSFSFAQPFSSLASLETLSKVGFTTFRFDSRAIKKAARRRVT